MGKLYLIFISVFISAQLFSQENVQWRGINRDGVYHETGLLKSWPAEGPKLLWHYDELGEGHASAAVTSNRIFTAGTSNGNGFIIALDLFGNKTWKTEFGKEWMENWEGVRSTPLIEGDKLFIMSSYGKLICMGTKTGNIIWTVELFKDYDGQNITWGVTENLLLDGNKLICTPGGKDANIIALDKNTGKLIWKSKGTGEKSAYCSPLLIKHGGRTLIVTHTESHIIGIDALNGKFLWKHPQPNKYSVHANTPLFHNGQIFCVSGYGQGAVMLQLSADGNSVKELWRNKTLDSRMGGMVLYNERIYGSGDFSKKWVCLDWKTGKELGTSTMVKNGNIILADGMLYCYGDGGNIALAEPKTDGFGLKGKFKVPYGQKFHWAHLVIANKRLYVRHGTSLMVYSIAAK
jgi:outer membrane protein assembly factor BamB